MLETPKSMEEPMNYNPHPNEHQEIAIHAAAQGDGAGIDRLPRAAFGPGSVP